MESGRSRREAVNVGIEWSAAVQANAAWHEGAQSRRRLMRKLIFVVAAIAPLAVAGCTTAEQTGVGGAAVGAAVGGLATGTTGGALGGALIGGTAGYLIGRAADRPGYCRYYRHDRYGHRVVYERRC
jgi:hypothetical protein